MDQYQRRAWLWTAIVFAVASVIAGIMMQDWLAGVGLFVGLHAVAWWGGWPPPTANSQQEHMLKNPGRGS